MPPTAAALAPQEPELQAFLAGLEPATALRVRTLAHAWALAGGSLAIGRLSIRLLGAGADPAHPYTAATLHARAGTAALELSRVLLHAHGVGPEVWQEWCDERAELRAHGFVPQAKFPAVRLDGLGDPAIVRLALGLRDLARMAPPPT
ncbi:MAG: hypothetical protein QOI63_1659 [Thermoplasmata archaeon]|jgi:histidinol-phosphate/aromatic aminotransferase/cobyric acid decarboxylase-like protein|nr:hypothetical protein [Thermoplasmata archaeon]